MQVQNPLAPRAPVGVPAPDFAVEAFFPDTVSVGTVKLSDFRGKWVLLLFYSSDFTFV